MLDTRSVLAIGIVLLFATALVLVRFDRRVLSHWLLAAGFSVATLWSILGVAWAQSRSGGPPPKFYLMLTTAAGAAAIYFARLARTPERRV